MMGWIENRSNKFLNQKFVRQGLPAKSKAQRFRLSLYRPALWTKFRPLFASKMGTYVSRNFFLTTEFAFTYVCRMYC